MLNQVLLVIVTSAASPWPLAGPRSPSGLAPEAEQAILPVQSSPTVAGLAPSCGSGAMLGAAGLKTTPVEVTDRSFDDSTRGRTRSYGPTFGLPMKAT